MNYDLRNYELGRRACGGGPRDLAGELPLRTGDRSRSVGGLATWLIAVLLLLAAQVAVGAVGGVTNVYTGSAPNAGDGDTARAAFSKINTNFQWVTEQLAGPRTNALVNWLKNTNSATMAGAGTSAANGTWYFAGKTNLFSLDSNGSIYTNATTTSLQLSDGDGFLAIGTTNDLLVGNGWYYFSGTTANFDGSGGQWTAGNGALPSPTSVYFGTGNTNAVDVINGNLMVRSGDIVVSNGGFVGNAARLTNASTSVLDNDAFIKLNSALESGSYFSNFNRYGWSHVANKIRNNQPFTILRVGDGLAAFGMLNDAYLNLPKGQFNFGGYKNLGCCDIWFKANSGAVYQSPFKDGLSYGGYLVMYDTPASVIFDSVFFANGFKGNNFSFTYLQSPGFGHFLVETQQNGGAFATVTSVGASGVINAAGTFTPVTISWSIPTAANTKIRLTNQDATKTNYIFGGGIWDSTISNAFYVADWSGTASTTWSNLLGTNYTVTGYIFSNMLAPDLILDEHVTWDVEKPDGTPLDSAPFFRAFLDMVKTNCPNADHVLCGNYPLSVLDTSDAVVRTNNNREFTNAVMYGLSYFDGYNPFGTSSNMLARGWVPTYGNVHLNAAAYSAYDQMLYAWLDLPSFKVAGPPSGDGSGLTNLMGGLVSIEQFGAINGDRLTNCAMTSGSQTLTCAQGHFVAGDANPPKGILVTAAGSGGAKYDLFSFITNVNSATSVTLSNAAGATVANTAAFYCANNQGPLLVALAQITNGSLELYIPPKEYGFWGTIDAAKLGVLYVPDIATNISWGPSLTLKGKKPPAQLFIQNPAVSNRMTTFGSVLTCMEIGTNLGSAFDSRRSDGMANNLDVSVEGVLLRMPSNPQLGGWNLKLSTGSLERYGVDTGWPEFASNPPITGTNAGVTMPTVNNSGSGVNGLYRGYVYGFPVGIQLSEHDTMFQSCVVACNQALRLDPSYHSFVGLDYNGEGNKTNLAVNGAIDFFFARFDVEHDASPNNTVFDVDDPSNLGHGEIKWTVTSTTGFIGTTNDFRVNGGSHILRSEYGELPQLASHSFASASNTLSLRNGKTEFTASGNCAVTNASGFDGTKETIMVFNNTGGNITLYMTDVNVTAGGTATNALIIPAGKMGIESFQKFGSATVYATMVTQ